MVDPEATAPVDVAKSLSALVETEPEDADAKSELDAAIRVTPPSLTSVPPVPAAVGEPTFRPSAAN